MEMNKIVISAFVTIFLTAYNRLFDVIILFVYSDFEEIEICK